MTTAKARMPRTRSGGRRVSTVLLFGECGMIGLYYYCYVSCPRGKGRVHKEREGGRERERTSGVEGVFSCSQGFLSGSCMVSCMGYDGLYIGPFAIYSIRVVCCYFVTTVLVDDCCVAVKCARCRVEGF